MVPIYKTESDAVVIIVWNTFELENIHDKLPTSELN